jgi:L-ascorbate metabolism protein UlaG (beta-lactamase superfamily)
MSNLVVVTNERVTWMRLRKLGHSCLLAEDGHHRLLIDPGCFSHGLEGLRELTAVLITHVHEDHLDIARVRALLGSNPGARIICDEASAAPLSEAGVAADVVQAGDELDLGVSVSVHGREHAVIHPELPSVPNVGYLLGDRLFVAGDAFTVPDNPVEILAVPVGAAWMKASDAVDWLRIVRPRVAIPVHDHGNVFAEWICHLFEQLSPAGTAIQVLGGDVPAYF